MTSDPHSAFRTPHSAFELRLFSPPAAIDVHGEGGSGSSSGEPSPGWTLREFFEHWYRRHALGRRPRPVSDETIAGYRESLSHWELLTGDPPLRAVADGHITDLVAGLRTRPGRSGMMAVATQRKHLIRLGALLKTAGPKRPGFLAAGLIDEPLFFALPEASDEDEPPLSLTLDELRQLYAAADKMRTPKLAGVDPGDWWRALVITGYQTGLRIGTLRRLQWSWIDVDGVAHIPKEAMKGKRRSHKALLSQQTLEHLRKINAGQPECLHWPGCERRLYANFESLVIRAGLDWSKIRGSHSLRRTHATLLEKATGDPLLVAISLAHQATDPRVKVLHDHYADRRPLMLKVRESLPSFLEGSCQLSAISSQPEGESS